MKSLRSMPYQPFYRAVARSVGLTAPQLNALEALAWSPDGEVWCRDLGIPQASVRKLAKLGLVTIRKKFPADGNGYVSLTPKGLETKRRALLAGSILNGNGIQEGDFWPRIALKLADENHHHCLNGLQCLYPVSCICLCCKLARRNRRVTTGGSSSPTVARRFRRPSRKGKRK